MYDELTEVDIKKMQEEIDYRVRELRPKLIADVQTARAFGDLSENFEYKAAKQEKNRNESRIRYLENMIRTSQVVEEAPAGEGAALYDKLTVTMPGGKTAVYQVVTTMRADPLQGRISLESPVGKALLGRKPGDTVHIQMGEGSGYDLVIQSIEKGQDDSQIPLNSY